MIAKYYTIKALTNIHVGSGDANMGVIDNLIQRDVVSNLPTINGSSLKGALKEFFESKWNTDTDKKRLTDIFGGNEKAANFRFLPADLLAMPLRSNKNPYYLATAPMVINKLRNDLQSYGINNITLSIPDIENDSNPIVFNGDSDGLIVEDFESIGNSSNAPELPFLENTDNVIVLNDNDFKKSCDDKNLPVIARNKLEGSGNLWYEQIVPRESIFGFAVLIEKEDSDFKEFNELLTGENSIIHIGANATIGQGFCKISALT